MSRISAMAQITFLELQTTVLGNFCPWIQNFSVHSVSYHRLAANTRGEQMVSALPPRPDIAQCGRHVRFVPTTEVPSLTRSPRRRGPAVSAIHRDQAIWLGSHVKLKKPGAQTIIGPGNRPGLSPG